MKRKSTLALIMVMMLACVFMLSACNNGSVVTTTEGLAEYFEAIKDADNFTAKCTITMQNDGYSQKAGIELKCDENKFKVTMNTYGDGAADYEESIYVEILEEKGLMRIYMENYGDPTYSSWMVEEYPLDALYEELEYIIEELGMIQGELFGNAENTILNAENYTFSEKSDCFILNKEIFNIEGTDEEVAEILDMIKITLKITEGNATMAVTFNGGSEYRMNIKMKLDIYKLGETTVRLPNVK